MGEPPAQLDGANVLCWVVSQGGSFYTQAGSDPPIVVVAMAVARYADGGPFYLFKCDRNWEVVGDWDCGSVVEAGRVVRLCKRSCHPRYRADFRADAGIEW